MGENSVIEQIVPARVRSIGAGDVLRLIPTIRRRTVGPFVFIDHMGPAPGELPQAVADVPPHPHIGIATVTYLFEGAILHRDSLGSKQLIEAGAVNWMSSGRGIVHSERTPAHLRDAPPPSFWSSELGGSSAPCGG